jgi:hypothetical protein
MDPIYPEWSWIIWAIAPILIVTGILLLIREKKGKQREFVVFLASILLTSGAFIGFLPTIYANNSPQQIDNLASNIKTKYNVKDVVTDYPNHHVVGWKETQEVVIITQKGQTVMFVLKQNPKTSEPTLLDSAVQSGLVSSGSVMVKDITR